jgi:RNA polymerase sigma-70 factor (ECF subfamily)
LRAHVQTIASEEKGAGAGSGSEANGLPRANGAQSISRLDTEELVRRARRGDRSAFEELYHRYYPAVAKRLTHMLGPSSPQVSDLIQDTFAQAYQNLSRFRGDGHFCHWLLRIASNQARSSFRRSKRSIFRLWDRPERQEAVASPLESVDETYPTLHAVHQALGTLSPTLREAVVLFELEGLSLAEMSVELGVPLHTAASRVRRGRERLRKALERMGYTPLMQATSVAFCNGEQR